jgi:hypothetical protein
MGNRKFQATFGAAFLKIGRWMSRASARNVPVAQRQSTRLVIQERGFALPFAASRSTAETRYFDR